MSKEQTGADLTVDRWKEEAAFFDRVAEEQAQQVLPDDPLTVQRYASPSLRRRSRKEFQLRILGDIRGKRVLDVGCGEGSNAMILARLGAQVTGIDISSKSIEVAQRKAEVNGLMKSAQFVCSPLEKAEMPSGYFDVIWGDSILHHLIENLDFVLQRLTLWAKPGALMVFGEPVNFNGTLRRLRFKIPVKADGTPDERPLEPAEVEIVKRFVPDLRIRSYELFGRLNRFILVRYNYERSPLPRRVLANTLAYVDYALLALPIIRDMAGYAVFHGHVSHST